MQEIGRMLHHRTRARFWNWGLPVRYRYGLFYVTRPADPEAGRLGGTIYALALGGTAQNECPRRKNERCANFIE